MERFARQSIQNIPQGHVDFIPFLGFDKAHLVEGLGVGSHRIQCLGLGIIARFSGTEPRLRIFCEMPTREEAERLTGVMADFLGLPMPVKMI